MHLEKKCSLEMLLAKLGNMHSCMPNSNKGFNSDRPTAESLHFEMRKPSRRYMKASIQYRD